MREDRHHEAFGGVEAEAADGDGAGPDRAGALLGRTHHADPHEVQVARVGTLDEQGRPALGQRNRLAAPPVRRELSTDAYRVPSRLRRFLEHRDQTCVFPGCNRPAASADKDHRTPWPAGATTPENLQCLCRHHHRAKQTSFTVTHDDRGHWWTTRGGWRFLRRPKGY